MNSLVFVYGTLKNGHGNNRYFLGGSKFLGKAVTKNRFVMFGVGFPLARLPRNDTEKVKSGVVLGEVFEVSSETLSALDRLEGHPNFYKREPTSVKGFPEWDTFEDKNVWMYQWNDKAGRTLSGSMYPKFNHTTKEPTHDW